MFHLELHIYEGFISRQEEGRNWKTGLGYVFGLNRSQGVEISDIWQASAKHLLNRIFQKSSPSDKQSTESLCDNLNHFIRSLGSSHERMEFKDKSRPPLIMVGTTRTESKVFIINHLQLSNSNQMLFSLTGIRADIRDFGSDLGWRTKGEVARQLEKLRSSCPGPVRLHGHQKLSNQPGSERLGWAVSPRVLTDRNGQDKSGGVAQFLPKCTTVSSTEAFRLTDFPLHLLVFFRMEFAQFFIMTSGSYSDGKTVWSLVNSVRWKLQMKLDSGPWVNFIIVTLVEVLPKNC